ncbi:MAG TPA: 6,7-dimethyl-8-ribityllumazine synthase [Gemmataceae bacterium]|nr:6,7-dimethyl-8-ribityllumazine synthase [Gemmataceae bacterium]
MPNLIEGNIATSSGRFAVVAARFNHVVVDQLVTGAVEALLQHGTADGDIDVIRVPGCFEIPLVAQRLAQSKQYAAVICLGAVIRGETDHYDYVAGAVTDGVGQAALNTGVPCIFGVLTCDTVEQALRRAGPKSGNKGFEAALAAIEMVNLLRKLPGIE